MFAAMTTFFVGRNVTGSGGGGVDYNVTNSDGEGVTNSDGEQVTTQ